jgi:hypothetical protein
MVREMEYFITQALIVFKLENFEDNKGVVRIRDDNHAMFL